MSLSLLTLAAVVAPSTAHWYDGDFAPQDIITKDVVIIGGGSSGTYGAVRLREDYKKSVVVVEKGDRLGGHVNTYVDPLSGVAIDFGVEAYLRYGHSVEYFQRFGIAIAPYGSPPLPSIYVSTTDGTNLTTYEPPAFPDVIAAFQRWLNVTSTYKDQFGPGLWDFFAPGTIPTELLQPFGQFATERNLTAAIPLLQTISNVGVGGLSDTLTLEVIFAFGQPVTAEFLNSSLFVPANHSNSYLYERAYDLLKADVLLESEATSVHRTDEGVTIVVQSRNGSRKLIKAKQLLFTPPPSVDNLALYGLDANETDAISTFTKTWSFAAVARIPAISSAIDVYWTSPHAVPNNQLDIRDGHWTLLATTAPNVPATEYLFEVLFASDEPYTHAEAKIKISAEVQKAIEAGSFGLVNSSTDCAVEFVAFVDHNSVLWRQNASTLQSGIVQDIYRLQGRKSTWFTGGLWAEDYSGNVWAFTDTVIPKILDRLNKI
ncbi:hypothetical protein LTR86_006096 [Recurvomyces mirabilis]|nr:hypothetical protein LTR86_006096 [Recurvomyces mirabilis]